MHPESTPPRVRYMRDRQQALDVKHAALQTIRDKYAAQRQALCAAEQAEIADAHAAYLASEQRARQRWHDSSPARVRQATRVLRGAAAQLCERLEAIASAVRVDRALSYEEQERAYAYWTQVAEWLRNGVAQQLATLDPDKVVALHAQTRGQPAEQVVAALGFQLPALPGVDVGSQAPEGLRAAADPFVAKLDALLAGAGV